MNKILKTNDHSLLKTYDYHDMTDLLLSSPLTLDVPFWSVPHQSISPNLCLGQTCVSPHWVRHLCSKIPALLLPAQGFCWIQGVSRGLLRHLF